MKRKKIQRVRAFRDFLQDLVDRDVLEPGLAELVWKEWRIVEASAGNGDGRALRRAVGRLARLFVRLK